MKINDDNNTLSNRAKINQSHQLLLLLCFFLGKNCFCSKPKNLIKPECLKCELNDTKSVTHWVEVLQRQPDAPVVVLSSVDQDGNGVVENTHDKE